MFRVPICRMSAYEATSSTLRTCITSVINRKVEAAAGFLQQFQAGNAHAVERIGRTWKACKRPREESSRPPLATALGGAHQLCFALHGAGSGIITTSSPPIIYRRARSIFVRPERDSRATNL